LKLEFLNSKLDTHFSGTLADGYCCSLTAVVTCLIWHPYWVFHAKFVTYLLRYQLSVFCSEPVRVS